LNPELTPGRAASAFDWLHSILAVPANRGELYVLNGGFPINFTGAVDPISPEQIELTRCLMLAGVSAALEALHSARNFGGPVKLAPIPEEFLKELFISG
jgi:hypothetical protein